VTDYGIQTTLPIQGESLDQGRGMRTFIKYVLEVGLKVSKSVLHDWHAINAMDRTKLYPQHYGM